MEIEGSGELLELNHERGGHRIQRVPPTERSGRVHSSTVTVAVTDEAAQAAVTFNTKDFRVEWYSGTGAGGQHRNKHQNSCRITHSASGLVVTSQCRSRENSLNEAREEILSRLYRQQTGASRTVVAADRKRQVGSGERGDKIRTYRFQDGIVKDHQTGKSAALDRVMAGNFDLLW